MSERFLQASASWLRLRRALDNVDSNRLYYGRVGAYVRPRGDWCGAGSWQAPGASGGRRGRDMGRDGCVAAAAGLPARQS
jgi:hypothetical protein